MRLTGLFCVLAASCLFAGFAAPSHAQPAQPGSLPPMSAAARSAIVDSVTAAIDSIYVLGEPAARIVAELKRALAAGEYDRITDPAEFAQRLHDDCQRVNHDGHFQIYALPPADPAAAAPGRGPDPAEVERRNRFLKSINYGFRKAEILQGGVGYLRFDAFANGDDAFQAATAAMNFVSNCGAVILDLRYNGGGSASMIRYICGYLFPEETHLINWDIRAEKRTEQSYSADFVPGRRIVEQPVYILTSRRTFSAAEEFTFDLRNLERATVVGDTTGGGGHTVEGYIFVFDGFRIGCRLPYGRAYNPKNNEGWEGVGVIPHVPVPADRALETAHALALRKILETEKDERAKAVYEWALADIESRGKPLELAAKQMKKYTGVFGPRRVFIEDGGLWYQREAGPKYRLALMGKDLFRVGDLDYFRLSFGYDDAGRIVKAIGIYNDGRRDENPKSGS